MKRRPVIAAVVALCALAGAPASAQVRQEAAALEALADELLAVAARNEALRACLREVPVRSDGDPDGRFGFVFQEAGGALGRRTALVLAWEGRVDFRLLEPADRAACDSPANGRRPTAAPRTIGERIAALGRSVARLERATRRFDRWASCLSELAVAQAGDGDGEAGFLFTGPGAAAVQIVPALSADVSDRETADYVLLGFAGRDRPGGPCPEAAREDAGDSRALAAEADDLDAIAEDLADLQEPVLDMERFDACAFTVGARRRGTSRAGFVYSRGGRQTRRGALTLDLATRGAAPLDLLAFPPEEPPGIECDEDGGEEDEDDDRAQASRARALR